MKYIGLLFFLLLPLNEIGTRPQEDHKYYVSVSNVRYNKDVKRLQMVTRFFIDDLEDVLSERTSTKITFNNLEEINAQKKVIDQYLKSKITFKVDGKKADLVYLGADYEIDQVALYIEFPHEKQPEYIDVKFTALMEYFEEQKNLVHFNIKDKRKTLILDLRNKKDIVKF